jgi:hypothetical protein
LNISFYWMFIMSWNGCFHSKITTIFMKEGFFGFSFYMRVLLYYKWNQGAHEFGKKLMVRLVIKSH